MASLLEAVQWNNIPIGSGAASGAVNLSIGTIGSGTPIGLITAGIHGDEGVWGAWAIRKLLMQTALDDLRGTLRIIPTANPLAMEADLRNAPLDMLDLNRVFPGNPSGSHTERLAAAIVEHGAAGANVVIDLHGGGSWCVNAFAHVFAGFEALAQAFNPPFLANAAERTVTLTGYARTQGAQVVAMEMGGKSEQEDHWAERIALGLRRVLGMTGVLSPVALPEHYQSIPVGQSMVLRPSRGGLFVPRVRTHEVGTMVPQGTLLGELLDPYTLEVTERFEAPFAQTALLLLRPQMTRIEGGAMTYVIAEPVTNN
ncbi:MAG TPA: M14 family metallopeptidase [Phototrophicaceae bacterium]|nr:M14 family metallopeptidase [Phototrophicaceae bacterium]